MRTAHGDYGIGFPLAAKAQVKGPNPHPFYKWAAAEAVFATEIEPMDARVIDAIVKELPPE
jgi:glutathione peroxidase-family protein